MHIQFRGIQATTADAVMGGIAALVALALLGWIGWTLNAGGWHVRPNRAATICQVIPTGDTYLVITADDQKYLLADEVRIGDETVDPQRAISVLDVGTAHEVTVRMVPGDWNRSLIGVGSPTVEEPCPA